MTAPAQSRPAAFLALLAVSVLAGLAAESLSPGPLPPGTFPLSCVSYDPRYRYNTIDGGDVAEKSVIAARWLERDLRKVSRVAGCVRTYYVSGGMEAVPAIAERLSLQVILGVEISTDAVRNRTETDNAIRLAAAHRNIRSILVGNENILKARVLAGPEYTAAGLAVHINRVRSAVHVPVSTAETPENWLKNPELAAVTDFIAVNDLPYWDDVPFPRALQATLGKIGRLRAAFPGRRILLSETGWPYGGLAAGTAQPDPAAMRWHLTEGLRLLRVSGVEYNVLEAFDQSWKRALSLDIDPYWGLYTRAGLPKFTAAPSWRSLPALFGLLCGLAFLLAPFRLRAGANLALFVSLQVCAACMAQAGLTALEVYQTRPLYFILFFALPALGIAAVLLISVLETADLLSWARPPQGPPPAGPLPFVSVHVPCRAEDPAMVLITLRGLLALDYPDYEVIVMDNNSSDPALYGPVRDFCALHPGRLRFFHEDALPGNKGGALNYALERTDPRAELVAVVDADYLVRPEWLRETAPLFSRPETAAVQAPQAYRDWAGSVFKRAMRDEYTGFFRISMVQRAARNAIIQHGTMLVLRRAALTAAGGWSGWCITEDTELGLRLLFRGWRVEYVEKVYGEGLVPDTFGDYRRQRYRWAYGAASLLARYAGEFTGLRPGLTPAQRYFFLAGWTPWALEALAPVFMFAGLLLAQLWVLDDSFLPRVWLAAPFFCLTAGRSATLLVNYRLRVGIGAARTLLSWLAGAALTWTIAGAMLRRLAGFGMVFHTTGKGGRAGGPLRDAAAKYTDLAAAAAAPLCAYALLLRYGFSATVLAWGAVLLLLAAPPASALLLRALQEREKNRRRFKGR